MYFIEHFLDASQKDGHSDYIRMMQRDIIRIVDAVAPDDGSGAANVRVVRKVSFTIQHIFKTGVPLTHDEVLQNLHGKGYLETPAVEQILEVIKERETSADDLGLSSPTGDSEMTDGTPVQASSKLARRGAPHRLDKRQVEQRIEEDRERHKRERENIWAIPMAQDAELNKLWAETSDFGEDDHRLLEEEAEEFRKEMEMQKFPPPAIANRGS